MYIRGKPDFSIGESPIPVTYDIPQDEFILKINCEGFRLEDESGL
jgi:hypothetical protein